MREEIQEAIDNLRCVLQEELGGNVVSVRIFISNSEEGVNIETRSPASLKSDGISMKNISGEWIK